jgi:hypothetical protein
MVEEQDGIGQSSRISKLERRLYLFIGLFFAIGSVIFGAYDDLLGLRTVVLCGILLCFGGALVWVSLKYRVEARSLILAMFSVFFVLF